MEAGPTASSSHDASNVIRGKKQIAAYLGITRGRLDYLVARDKEPLELQTDVGGIYVTVAYANAFKVSQQRPLRQAIAAGLFTRKKAS